MYSETILNIVFDPLHACTDDSSSQTESDKCRRLADHTPTIVAVSSSAVTLMTLLVLITVTIVAVLLMKPRLLFQKPDPPYQSKHNSLTLMSLSTGNLIR